jgi:hypothetical protein
MLKDEGPSLPIPILSPALPSPSPPSLLGCQPSPAVASSPLLHRSRPLKIQLGALGSAVSSPSGAPSEIEFGAF